MSTTRLLALRLLNLYAGPVLFAASVALMIAARLGLALDPNSARST